MHKLEKFYSSFGGIDTRQNKLNSDPKTFRAGTKNLRYNFQDEIQKANGLQHKSVLGFTSVGDIEYKYTDITTGEAKTQWLAVGTDGFLYKKRFQYIKFSSIGTATSYSFYYDEVADIYKLKFNSYTAINVSLTMTMDDLRVAINALGPVCTIVDENDATVSGSTKLAYFLDVVVNKELSVGTVSEMNSQYWEQVTSGGGFNDAPFTTTRDFYASPDYAGISYVNINNVVVITDGGFPMKYDGSGVYRMGQPKILGPKQPTDPDYSLVGANYNYSGIFLDQAIRCDGVLENNGTYQYVFQLGARDAQGAEVIGGYDIGASNLYVKQKLNYGYNAIQISIPAITGNFNWFRCLVKGSQNLPTGSNTIDVYPNHSIATGMTMRIPISNYQVAAYFGNATTVSASSTITNISDTSKMFVGDKVTGTNIPANSVVESILSETSININAAATGSGNITDLSVNNSEGMSFMMSNVSSCSYGYEGNAVETNGSPILTGLSDTSRIAVGALVEGLGIPANARVLSVDSSTQITLDANATSTGSISGLMVFGTITLQKGYDDSAAPNNMQYPYSEHFGYGSLGIGFTAGSPTATLPAMVSASLTTTSGSNTVTYGSLTPSYKSLTVGMIIDHVSLPVGTTITEVLSSTQFKTSNNATGTGTAAGVFVYNMQNYYVNHSFFAAGTFVASQTGRVITMSTNSNTTGTAYDLTFYKNNKLLIQGQTLSAGITESQYQNVITDINNESPWLPAILSGCFLRVWRSTKDTSNFYHLVDLDIPLTPTTFTDIIPDTKISGSGQLKITASALSRVSLVDADQGGELPRACKFVSKWQDFIVQGGRPVDPEGIIGSDYPTFYGVAPENDWGDPLTSFVGNKYTEADLCDYQSIYWNDSVGSESFSRDGLHEFKIESPFDDAIVGGAPNKDAFFAFKSRSTGVLVGSVSENNIQLELLEADIGLASHRSIQEVNGSLIWLDAVNGFYSCVAGRLPVNIGFPIVDYQKINATNLDWSKAVAANFRKENLYICAVEGTTFVFDYAADGSLQRNCWYIWDRFNTDSLLATSTDEFYLSSNGYQWKMKLTNSKYDFTDHTSAIDFMLKTAWLTQGAPTIDKQYVNLWVNSIQGGFTLDFTQYQNFLDYSISDISGVSFLAESSAKKLVKAQFKAANPKISGVSFGMRNNEKNAYVRIQGYELEYVAAFDTGEPKK